MHRPARCIQRSKLLGRCEGVDGVFNPVPAGGGADGETIETVRERGPRTLQHRGRGVSAVDLAALAREASPPAIAMARALPARSADGRVRPGYVTIVLIPESVEPKPWPELRAL
ncbi:MAG: hypothetical protein R2845_07100 [Thermomicrobiales bacterium]